MHTPPMTQEGIEARKVAKGERNAMIIARTAVQTIVATEALPEIATQAIDSP